MADVELNPPRERECELCGRRDEWDDERESWTIEVGDDGKIAGDPFCIHEWDINGTYNPIED